MASEPPASDRPDRGASSGGFEDTMPAAAPAMDAPGEPAAAAIDGDGRRGVVDDRGSSPAGSAADGRRGVVDGRGSSPAGSAAEGRRGVVDRYQLGAELGRGGMGRVVEAFDMQLGRTVALKEALPRGGSGTYRRFAREIQITARLEHASIVPLYDSGVTPDGRPYYVMRRVSGRPFDELITRARGLGERLTLLPALLAAIEAIGHAHRRGVIHRDLKPANILVGDLGETVVIDWGLAKVVGEDDDPDSDPSSPASRNSVPPDRDLQTVVGSVFGTPGFMAPEQARGEELGPRGDVYALGATLYQMLTGAPPHAGKSATEIIDRNRKAEIRPIAEAAPQAPRELIAIVTKALAADPADRYANGVALAEDVRRFLDGQLVAAHRYTRGQRVRRFARRNRAALVVAAAALAAVALLSWVFVHRVLVERAEAVAGRRAAEASNQELILAHARALLDTNPTQALAALKELPRGSALEPEARGIAEAATARGVAWGIDDDQTSGTLMFPALSPNGGRLSVSGIDGRLRVYDTVTHVLVRELTYDRGTRAIWIADATKLLVFGGTTSTVILDPVSGAVTATTLGVIDLAEADARGDRVIYVAGNNHAAGLVEVATAKITPLWSGDRVGVLTIAPDGSWLAVGGSKELAVFDGSGREVARKALGHIDNLVAAARARQLAVLVANDLWVLDLDHLVWTEVPPVLAPGVRVLATVYRGDTLTVLTTTGDIREWHDGGWVERLQLDQIGPGLVAVGADLLVLSAGDGRLHWVSTASTGTVALPSIMSTVRLAGSPGSSRLAVASDDLVLIYDLGSLAPQRIAGPPTPTFTFLDDDTLLFWSNDSTWTLARTRTGQQVTFDVPWRGFARLADELPEEGRALFEFEEIHAHLLEIRDDIAPLRHLAAVPSPRHDVTGVFVGALIPGGATVFASDNVLQGAIGDARPTELARLDGEILGVTRLGHLAYGAVSAHGELVRGSLAAGAGGGTLERGHVPADESMLAGAYAGQLVVGSGDRLLLWDAAEPREIAHFPQAIRGLFEVAGGVGVVLADGRVIDVAPVSGGGDAFAAVEILPRGTDQLRVANGGKLVLARGNGSLLDVVELPARVRWTVPLQPQSGGTLVIAPSSGQVVQQFAGLVTFSLPHIDPHEDLQTWLARQTNAVEDADRDLAWPWQKP